MTVFTLALVTYSYILDLMCFRNLTLAAQEALSKSKASQGDTVEEESVEDSRPLANDLANSPSIVIHDATDSTYSCVTCNHNMHSSQTADVHSNSRKPGNQTLSAHNPIYEFRKISQSLGDRSQSTPVLCKLTNDHHLTYEIIDDIQPPDWCNRTESAEQQHSSGGTSREYNSNFKSSTNMQQDNVESLTSDREADSESI